MNFQELMKIENYQFYIDQAFRNGATKAEQVRKDIKIKNFDRTYKSRRIEMDRIKATAKTLISHLHTIVRKFPNLDTLPEFYNELVKSTVDYDRLKKSLGAVQWAELQCKKLMDEYLIQFKRTKDLEKINSVRKSFFGRINSILKQINKDLMYLDEARKIMKRFPALKTSMQTVVLAGMPNVGKSTLLAALTRSTPKIAHYPFTTQDLNIGNDKPNNIQYVDTPGLLDRPLSQRNPIELQAVLALKHLAKLLIFVIDPTESCGYTVEEQKNLLAELKKMLKVPVILVSNKADQDVKYPRAISVSALDKTGVEELKAEIISQLAKQE